MRTIGTAVIFCIALVLAVASVFLGGCASVGPSVRQGADGQEASNSGGTKITVTDLPDGTGTSAIAGGGPTFFSNQGAQDSSVRGDGLVPTQVVVVRPDGAKISYFSAKDGSGKLLLSPEGNPLSMEFTAGASDPLRAFAAVAQVQADLNQAIAQAQADYLKNVSADMRETVIKAFDVSKSAIDAYLATVRPMP